MATQQPQSQPSSPFKLKHAHTFTTIAGLEPSLIVPLNDPRRTTPIDASLPHIRVPSLSTAEKTQTKTPDMTINPLTLKSYTVDDLKHHNFHALRSQQYLTSEAAKQARDESIAELRSRLEEADRRTREVEREMEEKEKTRETERRVWAKRRGVEGG